MDLDRGTLAKIDRKILSGLEHDESYHMVRVRVSGATWSTWKRYCDALGVSMGRAIVALIQHELRAVVEQLGDDPVLLAKFQDRVAEHRAVDDGERSLEFQEHQCRTEMRLIPPDPMPLQPLSPVAKVGRNDSCPCGSELKFKRCHGP